jgi:hypothetical protein
MIRSYVMLLIVLGGFASGCVATLQARDVQPSGFLGEDRGLLKVKQEEGGPLRQYIKPAAQWPVYDKIILEPVLVWDGLSTKLTGDQLDELARLSGSFYARLFDKLSQDYRMVEVPDDRTMRMTVAIIDAEKSWTAPAFLSKLVLELLVANKLWSLASGKPVFVGEASVEFKVQDARTGELLVAGVDRRVGGQKLFDREVFNSWGDVKNSLNFWADLSVYQLCTLRGRTDCIQPEA